MPHVYICRVCLSGNIVKHIIQYTPLQVIFEKLTSFKLCTDDGRPETVCYICHSQLQKYNRLMDKSQKSEEILAQLINSGIQILPETVSILNQGVQHDFCVTPTETYDTPNVCQVIVKEEPTIKQELVSKDTEVETGDAAVSGFGGDAVPCRMCLIGDVTASSINNTPLQIIYEKLTNTMLASVVGAVKVCYICHWQLMKCRKFIQKAKKSEKILTELFRNNIQLTQYTIAVLNSRMKNHLVETPVETVSYCNYEDNYPTSVDKNVVTKLLYVRLERTKVPLSLLAPKEPSPEPQQKEEQLECGICEFRCLIGRRMQEHLRLHDVKRQYQCNICYKRYSCSSHVKAHKLIHTNRYKCPDCDMKFRKKRERNMHALTHSITTYSCNKCDNTYKKISMLWGHKSRVHGDKYPCPKCKVSLPSETSRREHITEQHSQCVCDICNKTFPSKGRIRKHMIHVHVKNVKYTCDMCGKVFYHMANLVQHQRVHYAGVFQCDLCSKTFRTKYNLIEHLLQHGEERSHVCTVCTKRYKSENSLKSHMKLHTRGKFSCHLCNKQYTRKHYLTEHLEVHETGVQQTYTCDKCGKQFSLNGELKIHMYKHKTQKPTPYVTCKVCNKSVKDLSQHMRGHIGNKPYTCNICGKSFAAGGNLSMHMKMHAGIKPHECDICGKRFLRSTHLKLHLDMHKGLKQISRRKAEVRYPCDRCDRIFSEKRSLYCHVASMHETVQHYICDICYKVHTQRQTFIGHLKTHRRNKLSCDKCKRTFNNIINLSKHAKKHYTDKENVCLLCRKVLTKGSTLKHYKTMHGVTPYACNVCEEGFSSVDKVYSHYVRIHSGDTPYSCHLCDVKFSRSGGLKRHNIRMHST